MARHTSPKFVTVMPKAAAILTDAGSPTGHMALLAREFQVPTIINIGNATQILAPGQVVTVDANYNNVYEGLIPELLEPSAAIGRPDGQLGLSNPQSGGAEDRALEPHQPRGRSHVYAGELPHPP